MGLRRLGLRDDQGQGESGSGYEASSTPRANSAEGLECSTHRYHDCHVRKRPIKQFRSPQTSNMCLSVALA